MTAAYPRPQKYIRGVADAWLDTLPVDPWTALARWLGEARGAGLHEPEAAALATATPDGRPSVRMVLVRGVEERDLRVFTNHESRKADELLANPRAALCFHWGPPLRRQVRVEGRVERLPQEEARAYFVTRTRESRLGAWSSPQSRPLGDRAELDRRYAEAEQRFEGVDIPLPEWWGGYRLVPDAFELWQNRPNRLHDRARYERAGEGWSRTRLGP
jgi:pyridoxamine 5'-phosphate oxidase